ncbi:MAG: pectate lyase [Nibricoccus sp.]
MRSPFSGQKLLANLRFALVVTGLCIGTLSGRASPTAEPPAVSKESILRAMHQATDFMVSKVSTRGGYVWAYLPDLSRRWGELEAKASMIWIQPPGTGSMGHLFLDAYHATGDEYYYHAAEQVAGALIAGQHPSGGWNYVVDFAGEASLREWYNTIGRNAWRLEEFQHYYGNATFDDGGTAECSKFLLRMYVEKKDAKYRAPLEKAIRFVLDSQYPVGGWPQRYPRTDEFHHHGRPDYTSFVTLNDDVAAENIEFLLQCYEALGDKRLLDPIQRGMNCFVVTQQPAPQAGWALQYTLDLKPAGARTYEPCALATHTTAACIEQLLRFYSLTGDDKFIARIPEALNWLESVRSPKEIVAEGRTHPTFVEVKTNKPIYLHRHGSNVQNGEYYSDSDPHHTIGHYASFRAVDVEGLRARYEKIKATPVAELTKNSPLKKGKTGVLPRFYSVGNPDNQWFDDTAHHGGSSIEAAARTLRTLNADGYWPSPIHYTSHPYTHDGNKETPKADYEQSRVGDDTDTSPFPDPKPVLGISTGAYIRNMGVLIQALELAR